jgi:hypothetical protein
VIEIRGDTTFAVTDIIVPTLSSSGRRVRGSGADSDEIAPEAAAC